jgi:hypothetical protein
MAELEKTDDSQLENESEKDLPVTDKPTDKPVENLEDKPEDKYKDWVSPDEAKRIRDALHSANKEAQERREKLNKYEEMGLDSLEKAREILKEREDSEIKKAEEEKNFSEWQEKIQTQHQTQVEKYKSDLEKANEDVTKYRTQLESTLIDSEALRVISEMKGEPAFLLPYLKDEIKLIQDEHSGKMTSQIVDVSGTIRQNKNGKPMTIADRVNEMREDKIFGKAFSAPEVGGSGSSSTDKGAPSASSPKAYRNEMTDRQKQEYVRDHGIEAFNKLERNAPKSRK